MTAIYYPPVPAAGAGTAWADWHDLALMPEALLGREDIAAVNLACAAGLPGAEGLSPRYYLRKVDEYAGVVGGYTERRMDRFRREPGRWNDSEAFYRVLLMITVLQRDLGVYYNPEKIPLDSRLYPEDVFIHGVLDGKGGTCASLPVLYAAVGRRLGYPLKLVSALAEKCGHLFARWDVPGGERFNVEASNRGLLTPSDDEYRTGLYARTAGQEGDGLFLRSMTPRMELSDFLASRAYLFLDVGNHCRAALSFAWAFQLSPHNRYTRGALGRALRGWEADLRARQPPGFPDLRVEVWPQRLLPALEVEEERDVLALKAWDTVLSDPTHERDWWGPMRRAGAGCPACRG